ncbi:MAG: TIGR02266 family protein [Myxococcota bacterium]|jgi:uncharacterized protein (TIGR02266 family)|nr:TIGR02266 family protein [Myxococcota bacterium]
MTSDADHRIHPRYPLRVRIDLVGPHGFVKATTENLSAGGLFVATKAPYPVGSRVDLVLRILHAPPMELGGEVRWVRDAAGGGIQGGMGIQLHGVTAAQGQVIESFLRSGLKPALDIGPEE